MSTIYGDYAPRVHEVDSKPQPAKYAGFQVPPVEMPPETARIVPGVQEMSSVRY
jgi:hypothetical protein